MNLRYKRTRQWLLFWVLTLLPFSSLFILESTKSEALNIFLGVYFLFFYPIYCIFCFFRTIGIWIAGPEYIKDGYSQKFNAKLRANQIIMDLEDFNLKEKKRKKLEKELSAISKKYKSTVGSVKQL